MESAPDLRTLTKISNAGLIRGLKELVRRDRMLEADLLAYLGEVDTRELYLEEACSSMFRYCTEVLHFSENAAYSRITAARAARGFPEILDRIRNGALHVCGVKLLAPHLTHENHVELLAAAAHRSKRAIEELLADRFPKPSVPERVRKLPFARGDSLSLSPPPRKAVPDATMRPSYQAEDGASIPARLTAGTGGGASTHSGARSEPLGHARYRIQFTADRELHDALREAQALLRHQIPEGDLAEIFHRGLKLLVADVKRKRFASGAGRVRKQVEAAADRPSRHLPAAIRREVYARDGGRCTFVSEDGRRCSSREFLEFHHLDPWARFQQHRADRVVLFCRAHNQHAAARDYGPAHMRKCRATEAIRHPSTHSSRDESRPSREERHPTEGAESEPMRGLRSLS